MTNPSDDLLATSEGVDEGSAALHGREPARLGRPATGTLGVRAARSTGDATPAPPVDMESEASRGSRAEAGSGQQLQAGEG